MVVPAELKLYFKLLQSFIKDAKKKSGICHSSIIQFTYALSIRDLRAERIVMKNPMIVEP